MIGRCRRLGPSSAVIARSTTTRKGLQCLAGTAPVSYHSPAASTKSACAGAATSTCAMPCISSPTKAGCSRPGPRNNTTRCAKKVKAMPKPCFDSAGDGSKSSGKCGKPTPPLRCRTPAQKPDRPRLVRPPTQPPTNLNSHANKIRKKRLSNR